MDATNIRDTAYMDNSKISSFFIAFKILAEILFGHEEFFKGNDLFRVEGDCHITLRKER
jgi:hypothetical protein